MRGAAFSAGDESAYNSGMDAELTFDDVLLTPGYSGVLPKDASTRTMLHENFSLAAPFISAAMDTVTEAEMAIAIAQFGGLGVIHKNMSAQNQAEEVEKVKRFESGIVSSPATVSPDMTIGQVREIKDKRGFSGMPVVDKDGVVQGIITNRDIRFENRPDRPVHELMTPRDKLVSVRPGFGMRRVKALMHEHRIERVVITDARGILRGLVTVKDIVRAETFPDASKDDKKRLRAAAAIGINDDERAALLAEAGADALVVDSAHGHSRGVLDAIKRLKKIRAAGVLIVGGNIATAAGAKDIAAAGADVVKVGIGPGSICTTRMVAGVGVPQFSAIRAVAKAVGKNGPAIIADGGLRYSGDVAKAIAAGADAVMAGGMLAGTEESPGEIELYQGRSYKRYRGMGSLAAMRRGSGERYSQDGELPGKLVPEGVEGRVPFKGKVSEVLYQLLGGLRSAMGYVGAPDIVALKKAKFIRVSPAAVRESHVHDVQITREAPNYRVDIS